MMTKIVDGTTYLENGAITPLMVNKPLWNRAMNDIAANNTWCPDITRVIYNVGKKETVASKKCKDSKHKKFYDVLNCTVFFNDNTSVNVVNSENDPIEIVTVDGVTTASERSKEISLAYAVLKRMCGIPDANGKIIGNGFGRILRELVNGAWDQQLEEKKAKDQKTAAKAKYQAELNTRKPKAKHESLARTVNRLAEVVEKLENNVFPPQKSWCKKPAKRDAYGRFTK